MSQSSAAWRRGAFLSVVASAGLGLSMAGHAERAITTSGIGNDPILSFTPLKNNQEVPLRNCQASGFAADGCIGLLDAGPQALSSADKQANVDALVSQYTTSKNIQWSAQPYAIQTDDATQDATAFDAGIDAPGAHLGPYGRIFFLQRLVDANFVFELSGTYQVPDEIQFNRFVTRHWSAFYLFDDVGTYMLHDPGLGYIEYMKFLLADIGEDSAGNSLEAPRGDCGIPADAEAKFICLYATRGLSVDTVSMYQYNRVPEPNSAALVLMALAAVGGAGWAARRRGNAA